MSLPKGQIILYEGDPIANLYYLETGFVKVYNILETGIERIIFIYAPGDFFPMTSYLSGSNTTRYFYEGMVKVNIRLIRPEVLKDKMKGNLELGEALMEYAGKMNHQFVQRIDMLGATDARRKIIALLSYLVEKVGSPDPISQLALPLTAQNFADMCSLTRETANKKLVGLRREGIIKGARPMTVDTVKLANVLHKLSIAT